MSPNPKLASLSVTVLALGAVQAGAILLAITELLAPGEPRLDRYLMSLVPLGVMWLLVAVVDIFAFPTMRMTRLLTGPAAEVAVIATLVMAVMSITLGFAGGTLDISTVLADNATFFIMVWGAAALWKLGREWLRNRQLRRTVVQRAHSASLSTTETG